MTVIEITKKYLKDNGYDGLVSNHCGCGVDDFPPHHDCHLQECEAAYKQPCIVDGKTTCDKCSMQTSDAKSVDNEYYCDIHPPEAGDCTYISGKAT